VATGTAGQGSGERSAATKPWTVVVGVDDSPESRQLIAWVADLAARLSDARVVAVTGTTAREEILHDALPVDPDWRRQLHHRLHQWVEPIRASGADCHARLVERAPAAALVQVAKEVDADLIAVGLRPHHLTFRSLAAHLSQHAPCPVVAVPSLRADEDARAER